jgi:hypothetical protein
MTDDRFVADHASGNRTLTASRWPSLALPPAARPAWLPSPYALAAHMVGLVPLDAGDNAHLRRGKLLEPIGARLATEDYGMEIVAEQERVERADIPALTYIDLATKQGRVELKTVNDRDFERDWVGRPPLYPRTQAQCQMAITGDEWCYIGAIVIGYMEIRLELFEERRHDGMQDLLLERAGEFLQMLERGDLPLPDATESSYRAWSATAELTKGKSALLAEVEAVERAARWRQARADAKVAEAIEEACKLWFMANSPAGAERIELLDGTIVKRTATNRKGFIVEPTRSITWKFEEPK